VCVCRSPSLSPPVTLADASASADLTVATANATAASAAAAVEAATAAVGDEEVEEADTRWLRTETSAVVDPACTCDWIRVDTAAHLCSAPPVSCSQTRMSLHVCLQRALISGAKG
jgi:hypothetical protein